jgi:hypothetical protein
MKKIALILFAFLGPAGAVSAADSNMDALICINGICIEDRNDGDRNSDRRNRARRGADFVTCESNNSRYNECYIRNNFRARGVRLVNRHSRSSCRQGRDWGYTGSSIWVDNGCRATFRVVRY